MSSVFSMKSRAMVVACAGLVWAGGCFESDEPSLNDFLDGPPATGGATTAGTNTTGSTPMTTGSVPTTTGDTATTAGTTSGTSGTPVDTTTGVGGSTTGTDTTGGTTTDGGVEAGPGPAQSVIAGTFTNCSSYAAASGDMCAGYYCSVTEVDVANEIQPGTGPCSNLEPERVCGGRLTKVTGSCARDTKSNPLNAFDSDDQLRVKIRACIYQDSDIDEATVPVECTECFLDAAQCASDFCLGACLIGDSPECDKCRIDNGCNQTVPTCGGLPSPF